MHLFSCCALAAFFGGGGGVEIALTLRPPRVSLEFVDDISICCICVYIYIYIGPRARRH